MSLIYDIARGSFVDGPGIRTTVFFKGCPLDCPWCHNPESKSYKEEVSLSREDCISCGNCSIGKDCYTGAKKTVGKLYKPEEIINAILADKSYYLCSNGGVTFSGGEPLSFIPYLAEVLPFLKNEGINVAIQTSGYFDFEQFSSQIIDFIDLIFFDIKILDTNEHKIVTGKSNRIILENFEKLLAENVKTVPRIPLIPGYTSTRKNLKEIALYLKALNISECEFLYYNPDSSTAIKRVSDEENRAMVDYFKSVLGS